MKDKSPKDPAASIRARLLNHTREHDDNFQRILTRYAIERLLPDGHQMKRPTRKPEDACIDGRTRV